MTTNPMREALAKSWNADCDYVCDVLDSKDAAYKRGFESACQTMGEALVREMEKCIRDNAHHEYGADMQAAIEITKKLTGV